MKSLVSPLDVSNHIIIRYTKRVNRLFNYVWSYCVCVIKRTLGLREAQTGLSSAVNVRFHHQTSFLWMLVYVYLHKGLQTAGPPRLYVCTKMDSQGGGGIQEVKKSSVLITAQMSIHT